MYSYTLRAPSQRAFLQLWHRCSRVPCHGIIQSTQHTRADSCCPALCTHVHYHGAGFSYPSRITLLASPIGQLTRISGNWPSLTTPVHLRIYATHAGVESVYQACTTSVVKCLRTHPSNPWGAPRRAGTAHCSAFRRLGVSTHIRRSAASAEADDLLLGFPLRATNALKELHAAVNRSKQSCVDHIAA